MLGELLVRFVLGGLIVSAFAFIGDLLKPKSFSGIFGAAPSVALATLGLALAKEGGEYAGLEGRSMVAGAVALFVYSQAVSRALLRREGRAPLAAPLAAAGSWLLWMFVAFSLWGLFLR
jgi:hypothetical protein